MKRLILAFAVGAAVAAASPVDAGSRLWFGGGVGAYFGDVNSVSVEPVIGYNVTERFAVGGRLLYRYRHDSRYDPSLSASDYGAGAFARYNLFRGIFVQGEYEYLDYEYRTFDGSEDRDNFDSVLAGAGFSRPMGSKSSFYFMALYNLNYDDRNSPYSDPWVFRAGVAFGF